MGRHNASHRKPKATCVSGSRQATHDKMGPWSPFHLLQRTIARAQRSPSGKRGIHAAQGHLHGYSPDI